ncbi:MULTISPECIES: CBS domain-containing protein [unclassified Pseudoalteromonas]|uniref:CBS domain-containing protein n=1 Tax=unclassified Pseudoalteromonas TaxID=194690 RepID=UPI0025B5E3C9|nr:MULTISPECIES: CBS domain-containing protein [unclassified Pseudoalteromonas]MDN3378824.1 CBS domain-containing protein [Pseudoalteromonas sp. APC 3893]MDN3387312.1 CBS domain-containing protein [Pseudoalteromonas sp. APC 4017]
MLNTKVKDFMQHKLPHITPATEMTTAIAELQKFKLLGAPVFDDNKRLVGFISEQELLKPLMQNSYFCDGVVKVAQLMQTEVVTVNGDSNIIELAEQMKTGKPKNYPVVDGATVIGMIGRSDILKALYDNYLSCQQEH